MYFLPQTFCSFVIVYDTKMWLFGFMKTRKIITNLYENLNNLTKWSHNNFIQIPEWQYSNWRYVECRQENCINVIILFLVYFQDKKWMYCCYHTLFRLLSVTIYYNYLRCLWLWYIRNIPQYKILTAEKQPIEGPNAQKGK